MLKVIQLDCLRVKRLRKVWIVLKADEHTSAAVLPTCDNRALDYILEI